MAIQEPSTATPAPASPYFRDKLSWYLGISAYWFAVSYKWFVLLLLMPFLVDDVVAKPKVDLWWGRISGVGAIEAMIGPAVFGYFSDRHRSRFGRRRPFIAVGAALTAISLLLVQRADTLWELFAVYLLIQVSDDVATGPYAAIVPDMVPEHRRGRASGILSQLQLVAQIVAAIVGLALHSVFVLLLIIAVVNLICAAIVLVTVREPALAPVTAGPSRAFRLSERIRTGARAWIDPWRSKDFRWVWLTRFLNALGFYIVLNYLGKYLENTVRVFALPGVRISEPFQASVLLALVISVAGAAGAVVGGDKADRIGRKRVVWYSGWLMFVTLVPFALTPVYWVDLLLSPLFGFGYGAYLSAMWALAADILPSKEDAAKDMGIWQASVTTPQVVAGFLVGLIIYVGNRQSPGLGYLAAFLFASLAFLTGSVLVRRVRASF